MTLPAGSYQPRHRHYEEQIIYVIEGKASSKINGAESILLPGAFFHWEAGVEHEVTNIGEVPFRHLLVSNPVFTEDAELASLAERTFCTESHIARVFKKHMGMSIISYVHKVRIEKSVQLLEEKKMSVKEAAEAVGYQNLNHFYKYFHMYMETTPAAYIKNRRKKNGEEDR